MPSCYPYLLPDLAPEFGIRCGFLTRTYSIVNRQNSPTATMSCVRRDLPICRGHITALSELQAWPLEQRHRETCVPRGAARATWRRCCAACRCRNASESPALQRGNNGRQHPVSTHEERPCAGAADGTLCENVHRRLPQPVLELPRRAVHKHGNHLGPAMRSHLVSQQPRTAPTPGLPLTTGARRPTTPRYQ